jgi:hypothetical protein
LMMIGSRLTPFQRYLVTRLHPLPSPPTGTSSMKSVIPYTILISALRTFQHIKGHQDRDIPMITSLSLPNSLWTQILS